MDHCNTIFSQILKIAPRHEFKALAKQYHSGHSFRTASRRSQFVNLSAQIHRLYHLGSSKLSRSNLSRINLFPL